MFKKVINFLLIFLIILSVSTICFATDEAVVTSLEPDSTEENHVHTEDETVTIDATATEDSLTSETEENYIATDHYAINSNVTIDENTIIDGNAYIIADTVIIKGRIVGDLFVIANNVSIDGAYIYNNVFALAKTFTLTGQSVIYQLYGACENINIDAEGIVYRDLFATSSNFTLNGSVGRDAYIATEQLSVVANETGKNVYNNLTYFANSPAEIPHEAIGGESLFNANSILPGNSQNAVLNYVFDLVFALVFTSIVFLLVMFLTPKFVKNAYTLLTTSLGKTTIVGVIVLLAVPIVSIILLLTYVAVPVSIALITAYILLLSIGTALISICIANFVMNKLKKEKKFILYLLTLAVTLIIWALQLIPYLNILISLVVALYTLGLVITNLLPKKEKLKEISKEETK